MATLATTTITQAWINPDTNMVAAAVGGDKVVPGDRTFLRVKNGGGAPITVTLNDPTSVSPVGATQFNADVAVTVTNGQERVIGPITGRFADPADSGLCAVTYSAVTSVTVGALSL